MPELCALWVLRRIRLCNYEHNYVRLVSGMVSGVHNCRCVRNNLFFCPCPDMTH